MKNLEQFIEAHKAEIAAIRTGLAFDFDVPAQRTINAGFSRMDVSRFDQDGNDLWEMISCHLNGWEYEKPPAHKSSEMGRRADAEAKERKADNVCGQGVQPCEFCGHVRVLHVRGCSNICDACDTDDLT